jgi:hypothetical protein
VNVVGSAREFFLQTEALKAESATAFAVGHPGERRATLARSALRNADRIAAAGGEANPAIFLYLTAILLMLEASEPSSVTDAVTDAGLDSSERAFVLSLLSAGGVGAVAELSPARQREVTEHVRRVARSADRRLRANERPLRRLLARRWLRVGAAILLVVSAASAALIASRPENVALHRAVLVPHSLAGYDPKRLVDGDRTKLGFHTEKAPNEVRIDLGEPRRISRIVVSNRVDCCSERAVPLSIELEQSGKFAEVARRDTVFQRWRVDLTPTTTRFVRLVSHNTEPFHLNEVEVY